MSALMVAVQVKVSSANKMLYSAEHDVVHLYLADSLDVHVAWQKPKESGGKPISDQWLEAFVITDDSGKLTCLPCITSQGMNKQVACSKLQHISTCWPAMHEAWTCKADLQCLF